MSYAASLSLRRAALLLAGLAMVTQACSATNKRANPFTKPEDLQKISSRAKPTSFFDKQGKELKEWDLLGPFSNEISTAPTTPETQLERDIAAKVTGDAVMTEAMRCAAREEGHFLLQNDLEFPATNIKDFIRRRCGSNSAGISTHYFTLEKTSPEEVPYSSVRENGVSDLQKTVKEMLKNIPTAEVGAWYGQTDEKILIAISAGRRKVAINSIRQDPKPGDPVVLEGRVLTEANGVVGLITSGKFDYERCVADETVELPDFKVTCPITSSGPAIFQLAIGRKESLVTTTIFDQAVYPGVARPALPARYETSEYLSTIQQTEVAADASEKERILTYINALRAAAELEPVVLAPAQSSTNDALAPHFFEASGEGDDKLINEITMGLKAGWDIDGEIIDSTFISRQAASDDLEGLIARSIENPSGRTVLLSADADQVAIGLTRDGDYVGAIVSAYEFLTPQSHDTMVAKVWRTLDKERRLLGKPRFKRSRKLGKSTARLADRIKLGKMTPEKASSRLAEETVTAYNDSVRYFYGETPDLTRLPFSPELFNARSAELVVMVAPFKPEGYPHMLYSVTVVIPASTFKE